MFEQRSAWLDRVIPVGAYGMPLQPPRPHLRVRDLDAGLVAPAYERRLDGPTGLRLGAPEESEQRPGRPQGLACALDADAAEEPMVHRVPLRRAPRVMADRPPQPPAVRQLLLQALLPPSAAATVAPASVPQH